MEKVEKIFTLLSPFLSAYLVYLFAIKGKRKETDFQKEKDLNIILSNLLLVWHYLARVETLIEILKSDDSKSFVPKKYFPLIVLKSGYLNDKCFLDLDISIDLINKYDPLLFFKLEGIGKTFDSVRKKIILPLFKNSNIDPEFLNSTVGLLLNETLKDLEEYLETVAKKINRDTLKNVRAYISDHLDSIDNDLVEEMNEKFYEVIIQIIPNNLKENLTYEQFMELAKTNEFKKIIEIPLELIANNTFETFIDIISNNPDISIEEIQSELDKKQ